jgi:hypothetical protein
MIGDDNDRWDDLFFTTDEDTVSSGDDEFSDD